MVRRGALVATGVGAAALTAAAVAARVSVRPGAAVVRGAFDAGGMRRRRRHRAWWPDDVVTDTYAYREGLLLDVHRPRGAVAPLPLVVWTHGGGGLSGSRTVDAGWFAALASEGFVVAAPDYRLAPAATYPAALHDVADAIRFVLDRADLLGADPARVVLGGDSAGAQMSAQLAAASTSPSYARLVGVGTGLDDGRLRGAVLACGYYDLDAFRGLGRSLPLPMRWGVSTILWSVTGLREPSGDLLHEMSPARHVTGSFPPALLLGGQADPLTDTQSRPFADHLRRLGVDVTTVLYEPDHQPPLPHEYQFDLSLADARDAFDTVVEFLRRVTA